MSSQLFLDLQLPHLRSRSPLTFTYRNKRTLTFCSKLNFDHRHSLCSPPPVINLNRRSVKVNSSLNFPLISPSDHWGNWTALFSIGAIGSCGNNSWKFGTVVAYWMVPMRPLGREGWKIAAALMGRHIGGAVNYVAIAEALQITPSVLAAGLAADNVICAVYFTTLFALAAKIPPESSASTTDVEEDAKLESGDKLPLLQSATALAVSFAICRLGSFVTNFFAIPGGILPAVTANFVVLATAFPKQFTYLAPAGEVMALILMQVFFAVIGASGNVWNVINTAPSIFLFALVQLAVHLAVILGLGKLFRFDLKLLLLASNANVGGPTTACGMATAKGWHSLVVPGILAGIFGISIATFLGAAFGAKVLQYM